MNKNLINLLNAVLDGTMEEKEERSKVFEYYQENFKGPVTKVMLYTKNHHDEDIEKNIKEGEPFFIKGIINAFILNNIKLTVGAIDPSAYISLVEGNSRWAIIIPSSIIPNDTVKIGDKLVLIKSFIPNVEIGTIYRVTDVTDDIIAVSNNMGTGYMSLEGYEEYFKIIKKYPWTAWTNVKTCIGICEYKTNRKILKLKYTDKDGTVYHSHATCCAEDDFDLNTGLEIALKRLMLTIEYKTKLNYLKNQTAKLEAEYKTCKYRIK